MNTAATYLGVLVSIATLLSIGAAIGVSYMRSEVKNSIAELSQELVAKITTQALGFQTLREDILSKIEMKLDNYVRNQTFTSYSESHAKEHVRIDQEMTRLRDWKHESVDPEIRSLGAKVNSLEGRFDDGGKEPSKP